MSYYHWQHETFQPRKRAFPGNNQGDAFAQIPNTARPDDNLSKDPPPADNPPVRDAPSSVGDGLKAGSFSKIGIRTVIGRTEDEVNVYIAPPSYLASWGALYGTPMGTMTSTIEDNRSDSTLNDSNNNIDISFQAVDEQNNTLPNNTKLHWGIWSMLLSNDDDDRKDHQKYKYNWQNEIGRTAPKLIPKPGPENPLRPRDGEWTPFLKNVLRFQHRLFDGTKVFLFNKREYPQQPVHMLIHCRLVDDNDLLVSQAWASIAVTRIRRTQANQDFFASWSDIQAYAWPGLGNDQTRTVDRYIFDYRVTFDTGQTFKINNSDIDEPVVVNLTATSGTFTVTSETEGYFPTFNVNGNEVTIEQTGDQTATGTYNNISVDGAINTFSVECGGYTKSRTAQLILNVNENVFLPDVGNENANIYTPVTIRPTVPVEIYPIQNRQDIMPLGTPNLDPEDSPIIWFNGTDYRFSTGLDGQSVKFFVPVYRTGNPGQENDILLALTGTAFNNKGNFTAAELQAFFPCQLTWKLQHRDGEIFTGQAPFDIPVVGAQTYNLYTGPEMDKFYGLHYAEITIPLPPRATLAWNTHDNLKITSLQSYMPSEYQRLEFAQTTGYTNGETLIPLVQYDIKISRGDSEIAEDKGRSYVMTYTGDIEFYNSGKRRWEDVSFPSNWLGGVKHQLNVPRSCWNTVTERTEFKVRQKLTGNPAALYEIIFVQDVI